MNKVTSLKVKFNNDFKNIVNSEFVEGTALIAYEGENRNYSDIPEQAFMDATPTLGLIPIVGNWIPEKKNFGGHDVTIEKRGGELVLKDNTIPYGVVKENHNARWVEIEEDGKVKKYMEADVVLWFGRYQEPIQKVIDDGINQSMEINVVDFEEKDNGYFKINKFEYSALCLLGRDRDEDGDKGDNEVEPCFESASVVVNKFNMNDEFKKVYQELKFALEQDTLKDPLEDNKEGELTVEDVVVDEPIGNVEDVIVEPVVEPVVELEPTTEPEIIVDVEPIEESTFDYELEVTNLKVERHELLKDVESFKCEIETLKSELSDKDKLITELQEFKNKVELEIKQSNVDELIEDFSDILKDNEEFVELKKIAMEMEITELEKELYALEGKLKHEKKNKKEKKFNFSKVVPDEVSKSGAETYYGSASKYLVK